LAVFSTNSGHLFWNFNPASRVQSELIIITINCKNALLTRDFFVKLARQKTANKKFTNRILANLFSFINCISFLLNRLFIKLMRYLHWILHIISKPVQVSHNYSVANHFSIITASQKWKIDGNYNGFTAHYILLIVKN
jgi:hypothetical protein